MKTSSAKAKGRRLAQEAKDAIVEFFRLHEDDVVVTSSGTTGEDLQLSPLAQKHFPYSVETKNQERLNIWISLKQAEKNASPGRPALLIFRRNRSETYCVLKFSDFLNALSINNHKEETTSEGS